MMVGLTAWHPAIGLALLALLAVLIVSLIARRRSPRDIVRRWGLDPASCRVLASDLARHGSRPSLVADGLAGSPDALMRERREGTIIVGEAKSRHYRGRVTPYEYYQVTLYLGMAKRLYRRPVRAILLYGNGRLVPLEFDEDLYRRLLALIPRCRRAMA